MPRLCQAASDAALQYERIFEAVAGSTEPREEERLAAGVQESYCH
jgi:hypothetical protein